jgi:hypothetical protein
MLTLESNLRDLLVGGNGHGSTRMLSGPQVETDPDKHAQAVKGLKEKLEQVREEEATLWQQVVHILGEARVLKQVRCHALQGWHYS